MSVNLSQWDEVQAYMERQIADAILSSDWLAAHDAEKRAEWEAETSKDERLVRYMAMATPLGYQSALMVVQEMTKLLAAEHIARTLAEQGETEWEYGVSREVAIPMSSREAAERQIERMAKRPMGYRLTANLVRRRVTPWVAAPDTTNNESEDE